MHHLRRRLPRLMRPVLVERVVDVDEERAKVLDLLDALCRVDGEE